MRKRDEKEEDGLFSAIFLDAKFRGQTRKTNFKIIRPSIPSSSPWAYHSLRMDAASLIGRIPYSFQSRVRGTTTIESRQG